MVPRCTIKIEKCTGGMKITCTCDDKMACSMMQNLCTMLAGGMCTCCMMMNGMMVCCCNLTMGMCKCEMTDKGCCITCTSGDEKCCEMIQACCDCMSTLMQGRLHLLRDDEQHAGLLRLRRTGRRQGQALNGSVLHLSISPIGHMGPMGLMDKRKHYPLNRDVRPSP